MSGFDVDYDDLNDLDRSLFYSSVVRSGDYVVPRSFSRSHPLGDPALAAQFLGQEQSWCSASGYLLIEDMTPGHALAAANFVLDRAVAVGLVVYAGRPNPTNRDSVAYADVARRALLDAPLVKALVARGGSAADEDKLPWLVAAKKKTR